MPETENSKKRNLEDAVDEETDIGNGVSSKRQATEKPTSSLFRRNSDISPHEFALSIDLFLEKILNSLDQNSLLQCRLVSLRWKHASKKVMKKKSMRISFTYNGHYKAHIISSAVVRSREFPEAVHKSKLQDLTLFLKNSYTAAGPFTIDAFPCNTIEIRHGSVFNPHVRAFLDTFGNHIRNLSLAYTENDPRINCSDLLKKLEQILCSQVRNVEVLSFFMDYNCVKHPHHLTSKCSGDEKVSQSWRPNTSLRTLTTGGEILKSILENILSNFPNLDKISLASEDRDSLMDTVNRMQFLRQLHIVTPHNTSITSRLIYDIESAISSIPAGNPPIKLTSLSILFWEREPTVWNSWIHTQIRLGFVRLINKVVECSWDTLKSINLEDYNATALNGINWPRVMPKVDNLTLRPRDSCGLEIFPLDGSFNIQETFPSLQEVNLNVPIRNIQNPNPEELSRKCNLGPVLTVNRGKVNVILEPHPEDPDHVVVGAEEHLREREYYSDSLLSKLFPRAELSLNFQHRQM